MKILCLTAAAAAALVLAATSQARTTSHHRTTSHRWYAMTLPQRRAVVVREIRRQRAPIHRWLSSRSLASADVYPFCRALGATVPGPVCAHGQKLVHALAVLRRIDANLAARAAEAARRAAEPAHLAGWLCIHNGRHPGVPGDPHEGRGYNGQYSGVLQMSSGWGGYPVSEWNTLSDTQVYADAEAVASRYGFSYAWMAGQWPETFPPCADLF